MKYIVYPSALEFWLDGTGRGDVIFPYKMLDFSLDLAERQWDGEIGLTLPVSVMVSSAKERRKNSFSKCRVASVHLPRNAFVQIAGNVCVESLEMCFLEAAKDLRFSYLVELGNCLCANYCFDANRKFSQRSRRPVTSALKISEFLKTVDGFTGVKLARRAVKYVQDESGSPKETQINVIFFIPMMDGGFTVKVGKANDLAKLKAMAIEFLGTSECRADIMWNEDWVAFEYDSELTHANDKQRQYDVKRRIAMEQSGYKVITFTNKTISTFNNFEGATMMLRDALNMKKRPTEFEKFKIKRIQVFNELFKTPHSFY